MSLDSKLQPHRHKLNLIAEAVKSGGCNSLYAISEHTGLSLDDVLEITSEIGIPSYPDQQKVIKQAIADGFLTAPEIYARTGIKPHKVRYHANKAGLDLVPATRGRKPGKDFRKPRVPRQPFEAQLILFRGAISSSLETAPEIAEYSNLTQNRVRQIAGKIGFELKPAKTGRKPGTKNKPSKRYIRRHKLIRMGMPQNKIADIEKVKPQAISDFIKKKGLEDAYWISRPYYDAARKKKDAKRFKARAYLVDTIKSPITSLTGMLRRRIGENQPGIRAHAMAINYLASMHDNPQSRYCMKKATYANLLAAYQMGLEQVASDGVISCSEVAGRIGCTPSLIRTWMKYASLQTDLLNPLTEEDIDIIKAGNRTIFSRKDIADIIGKNPLTVQKYCEKKGIRVIKGSKAYEFPMRMRLLGLTATKCMEIFEATDLFTGISDDELSNMLDLQPGALKVFYRMENHLRKELTTGLQRIFSDPGIDKPYI